MTDTREAKVSQLAETIRRGHSTSVAEADRTLRQLEILTGDAATSTRLMHDHAPSDPARRAEPTSKQPA